MGDDGTDVVFLIFDGKSNERDRGSQEEEGEGETIL